MKRGIEWAFCFFLLSGLAYVQAAPPTTSSGNLLRNGGFNAAGWPPADNSFDTLLQGWNWQGYLAWTYRPDECLDGGGELGFGGGSGSISQLVATQPGGAYRITLTARSLGYLGGGYLQPGWGNLALPSAYAPISYTDWTEVSYDVQATAYSTLFTLAYVNNGPVWVDSVSIVPVPEPGIVTLGLAGAGLLWVRRRLVRSRVSPAWSRRESEQASASL